MGAKINIKGVKFGKLTALCETKDRTNEGAVKWLFQCSCGKQSVHEGARVRLGKIQSCGCGRKSKDPVASFIRIILADYKLSAKTRGLSFSLSYTMFKSLVQSNCHYCGLEPQARFRKFAANVNGVDRIDSSKGYVIGNVRPCCKVCNMAKGSLSDLEFKAWIRRIVLNYKEGR